MTIETPIPEYAAAREAMIDSQLRPQGVNDRAVLAAMAAVPRERFVPDKARAAAYQDRAVPLGDGRLLSPPAAIGLLLTQLAPRAGERALLLGAGTGYCAAVLDAIGLDVVAVECSPELAHAAKANGISVVVGPLESGHAGGAPYDLLIIDGAVDHVPQDLVDQLREGGRCGAGLRDGGVTRLAVGTKSGNAIGFFTIADAGLGLLPGFASPRTFRF